MRSACGRASLAPLDAELNLPAQVYSLEVQKRVTIEAARGSFDEAVASIERGTATTVSSTGSILGLSTDGKGVAMRKQDLRPQTRKAAEVKRPKLGKRLSKGEKRNAVG